MIAGKAITIRIETIRVDQVKIGIRIIVMPGARMLRMVTMKLNGAGHRGDTEDLQTEHPEIDVAAGIPGGVGQRRVAVPALVRRLVEEPAHVEDDARRRGRPRS